MKTNHFTATVISGRGRGRTLGFPTLNLVVPENFDAQFGSYAAHTWLGENEAKYASVLFFGERLTLGIAQTTLEIHLLDITDKFVTPTQLTFKLGEFLRPPERFASVDELITAIEKDCDRARELLERRTNNV